MWVVPWVPCSLEQERSPSQPRCNTPSGLPRKVTWLSQGAVGPMSHAPFTCCLMCEDRTKSQTTPLERERPIRHQVLVHAKTHTRDEKPFGSPVQSGVNVPNSAINPHIHFSVHKSHLYPTPHFVPTGPDQSVRKLYASNTSGIHLASWV